MSNLQPSTASNSAPMTPSVPSGAATAITSAECQYSAVTTDADGDALAYVFDWGDGASSTTAQVDSGTAAFASHAWTEAGTYSVQVKATDSKGAASASFSVLTVNVASPPPEAPATPESPALGTPEAADVDPSSAATEHVGGSPSPDAEGTSAGGPQRLDLALWLLTVMVMVGAAVLLTGAIVRDCVPKPPGWYGDSEDSWGA
jgi:hypothetical protein